MRLRRRSDDVTYGDAIFHEGKKERRKARKTERQKVRSEATAEYEYDDERSNDVTYGNAIFHEGGHRRFG